ncbi:MAG: trehalose-phosphatase, partial [Dehalococcoidia bacterium]
ERGLCYTPSAMAIPLIDVEPLRPVLAQSPLGLISDIDGTLSPIAPTPRETSVPEAIRHLLGGLLSRGVFVALITGRTVAEARGLVGLDGLAYAGNHGLSIWMDGREEVAPEAARYEDEARRVLEELRGLNIPGVWLEDKGPVIGLHYRLAEDAAAARAAILSEVQASPAAKRFRVVEGRMILELRPPVAVDKGTALARLAQRWGLGGLLCLGDDTTDIDMFRSARELTGVGAACIAVESEEANSQVLAGAQYSVKGVGGVEWLLSEVLRALP